MWWYKYIETDQIGDLKYEQIYYIFIIPLYVEKVIKCSSLPYLYCKCQHLYETAPVTFLNFFFFALSSEGTCLHSDTP